MDATLYDRLSNASAALAEATQTTSHDIVVTLGSGLGGYAERFPDARSVSFTDLPGFPVPHVDGHAGTAHSLRIGDNNVLLYAGRAHAYEGYDMDAVAFPIRAAIRNGCRTVVLSNASGGCGDGIVAGDLVAFTDHINLAGLNPLRGPNDDRLGDRFPDMTDTYTPELRDLATSVATGIGIDLKEGIYAWFQGPSFETPAEIQMAKTVGADIIGMSTVPEAIAARHMGANILAISLCANLAAGLAGHRLTAEEVMTQGAASAGLFGQLLDGILPRIRR